jgi:hypothetical protein
MIPFLEVKVFYNLEVDNYFNSYQDSTVTFIRVEEFKVARYHVTESNNSVRSWAAPCTVVHHQVRRDRLILLVSSYRIAHMAQIG